MIVLTEAMAHVIRTSVADYYEAGDDRLAYADRMVGAINAVLYIAEAEQNAEDPETKPEQEPKPSHSTKKLDLDMGKVRALRNAGWSISQIADEMRVSVSTVTRRLEGEDDVKEEE